MCTATTMFEMRQVIADVVAGMPVREEMFWRAVDDAGVSRERAARMLDRAVGWIAAGRGETMDPYAMVITWLPENDPR